MEDYPTKLHDLTYDISSKLWELREYTRGDQEAIAEIYEWLSQWLAIFEDDLYPDEEEN